MINIKTIFLVCFMMTTSLNARVGSVINVTSSGVATTATIIVCANINLPTSCQTNTITGTTVVLTPVNSDVYYRYMGLRAVTPGLQLFVNGAPCALNSFGFCSTPGSQASPPSVFATTTQLGTLACDGTQASTAIAGATWRCYTIAQNQSLSCGDATTHPGCNINNVNMPNNQQIADIYAQFGIITPDIANDPSVNLKIITYSPNLDKVDANGQSTGSWSNFGTALPSETFKQLCPCH